MSNIIGLPFDDWVKSQIDVRQDALGRKTNISHDNLKYYTTKTPWLRLASSIDLTDDNDPNSKSVLKKLTDAGIDKNSIVDSNLAKNFILQGGTVSLEETTNEDGEVISSNVDLKKGLNYDNGLFTGAYGWGGIEERGFVPMPGITNATTTYYNNGALNKAIINIKCFSKSQFQLIDVLYLRPGYTLLLEFGWTAYLNSNKNQGELGSILTHDGFKSLPLNFLLNPSSFKGDAKQHHMLSLIKKEREFHSGNYEAVFGTITNFKWSFDSDGSYNCEVNLIGMGSVIESLKLNVSNPKSSNQSNDDSLNITNQTFDAFVLSYLGDDLGQRILNNRPMNLGVDSTYYDESDFEELDRLGIPDAFSTTPDEIKEHLKPKFDASKKEEEVKNDNINSNPLVKNRDATALNKIFYDIYQKAEATFFGVNYTPKGGKLFKSYFEKDSLLLSDTHTGDIDPSSGDKTLKSVYIKFSTLLYIIQTKCNLFTGDSDEPLVKFDFAYANMKRDLNYMALCPPNISTNPGICLVGYSGLLLKDLEIDIPTDTPLNNTLNSIGFKVEGKPYVGRVGNVLLNTKFLAKALEDAPSDDDGAISVLSYIKSILDGINKSMGGINDFMVMNDSNTGTIKIYDQTPKIGLVDPISPSTKFNVFGVKENNGSFVTNVSLDASIPSNFATMISIGAQASGNNLMGNSTSFSDYNRGLIDRVIPNKNSYETPKKTEDKENSNFTTLKTLLTEKIYYEAKDGKSPFTSVYLPNQTRTVQVVNIEQYDFTPAVCKVLTENYTSYIKLVQAELSKQNILPSPFFLPFNLSLEVEGLSGMKLFQKFKISNDILPSSYENDNIDIIVKALNHSIDVQKWSTTIDTISVPAFNPPKSETPPAKTINAIPSEKQQKLEAIAAEEPIVEDDEDIIVRIVLTRLCDNGYQTLGLMEVLDEDGNLLYALPTAELPWKDNKNNESCIPVGTYNVSSRVSQKYGDCFIISELDERNEIIKTGNKITGYNPTDRGWVLIHEAPRAPGWLLGCIAPGFEFNLNNVDSTGNPDGTGTEYGGREQESFKASKKANEKLISTLWSKGKSPMFQITIKALDNPGGEKPPYEQFGSRAIFDEISRVESITGDYYMD